MENHDFFFLVVLFVAVFIPLFLAWYFVRRARFKEKIILIEKGIDIKDINLSGANRITSPWLRIGIIICGTALGVLIVSIANFRGGEGQALILFFTGLSFILAHFIGRSKDQSK